MSGQREVRFTSSHLADFGADVAVDHHQAVLSGTSCQGSLRETGSEATITAR